jgi:3-deoxy-manno-octulosonate cytidylyltransferase (CMP-KDO synthetase)
MDAVVIIPARYSSSRFPGKPLVPLKGKPMLLHVYERARGARLVREVIIATDDRRILEAAESFGAKVVMTSGAHPSGTDRVAEAARTAAPEADIFVNLQGDEPLIRPEMIDDVIMLLEDERADIGTLVKRIEREEEFRDPNVVKAVFNGDGFALYFSRSPIPFNRNDEKTQAVNKIGGFKHIGIYSYRREALMRLTGLRPTRLEETERLEQLRALENGMRIKIKETAYDTIGVDTPEDVLKVEECLNSYL